jgi:exopolysaccharide biosynthesis protein
LWPGLASCDSTQEAPWRQVLPGVSYRHDRIESEPWSIHVLRIERSRKDLEIHTTLAQGTVLGLSQLTRQVAKLPADLGRPVAAINGDFYVTDRGLYIGDPRGLQILDGELVSAPTDQASFWLDPAGNPQMTNVLSRLNVTWPTGATTPLGLNEERTPVEAVLYTPRLGRSTRTSGGRELILERPGDGPWLPLRAGQTYQARVREVREGGDTPLSPDKMVLSLGPALLSNLPKVEAGSLLKISAATTPDVRGVQTAISGGSVLIRGGKKETLKVPQSGAYKYASVFQRHPRTAVGANGKHVFFVQVDGRQRFLSVGMTLEELADYMFKLGCDLAMNLDGGASSTFWLEGRIMNSPCHGRERDIANGLVVIRKENAPNQQARVPAD